MSVSSSASAELGQATENVLEMLKTFMRGRGNTKQDKKKQRVADLMKIFRRYPSLINCHYKIKIKKKREDYTPLMCFLMNNEDISSIQDLIQTSPDPATTVSMRSGGGFNLPLLFALYSNQSALMTLLATTNPKIVTTDIIDNFFTVPGFPASMEMLENLLDINPTVPVTDGTLFGVFKRGNIPLTLLEKLVENCPNYRTAHIAIHKNYLSLEAIQIICKILPVSKIHWYRGAFMKIEPTSRQWGAESFLYLLQQIESNTTITELKLWVPDITTNDTAARTLIANGLIKMMTNNGKLRDIVLYCSSDVQSTYFWLDTALKAIPTASKSLASLKVSNERGFHVLIKGNLSPPQPICSGTTPTRLRLPGDYLSPRTSCAESQQKQKEEGSFTTKHNLLSFVQERLPTMCSLQHLEVFEPDHYVGATEEDHFSKETATRFVTTLLRDSPKLEKILFRNGHNRLPGHGIEIDMVSFAKDALQNNTSLRELVWYNGKQIILEQELQAMRHVLENHNRTLMQFSSEKLTDPQIAYYLDLNYRGRNKIGHIASSNHGLSHGATNNAGTDDLITILTSPKNVSVRNKTKLLGIWYGLLREAPTIWSNNNYNFPRHVGGETTVMKKVPPHNRKRKRGDASSLSR